MSNRDKWADAKMVLGYLASIAVMIVTLVIIVPYLFARLPNVVFGLLAMALIVPAAGAIVMALQGEIDWRPWTLWCVYLRDTVALLIELLFIVMILPVIAMQIAMVLGGIMAAALLIGLVAFAVQELTGLYLHIGIGWTDAAGYARYLVVILLGEALLFGLFVWLKGKEDSALDAFIDLRARIMAQLRPYAQDDPQQRRRKEHERRNRR